MSDKFNPVSGGSYRYNPTTDRLERIGGTAPVNEPVPDPVQETEKPAQKPSVLKAAPVETDKTEPKP